MSNFKNVRILVTGASGFTGAWLAETLLKQGAHVSTVLAHWNPEGHYVKEGLIHRVNNVIGDLTDYNFIERVIKDNGINAVFHLAALSVEKLAFQSPRTAFEMNVRGTYNLLDACRNSADLVSKVIVASSDKAYGDSPVLPYTEDMALRGKHPYDCSKSCQDLIAQAYAHSYGMAVAVARFGNIYGGGDLNWSRLIPGTIRRLSQGEAPVIRLPKQGNFMRDFLYIRDLMNAYLAMYHGLDSSDVKGQAFNFAMGGSWTVTEVVQTLAKLMKREDIKPVFQTTDHGEIWHQQVSAEKAKKLLGWEPQHTLESGLKETVEWYLSYLKKSGLCGNDFSDILQRHLADAA